MANFEHGTVDPQNVKIVSDIPAVGSPVKPNQASSIPGGNDGVSCTVPSFATASELLTAPYSCLVMNTHRRHIALAPLFLNKKKTGIKQELDAELLKFSPSLSGVPLAYDDIKIVGGYGHIYDDSGYIHMDIEANFIIFQPQTGQKLLGTVNKLGASHAGCLIHNCFNASIPKPNLVSMETWRDAGPRIGTELEFEVTALDADIAGVLLIRGRLGRIRVQELLSVAESSESSVLAEQLEETHAEPTQEAAPEPSDDSGKKKKKKKKDKIKEEQDEEDRPFVQPEMNGTTNGAEAVKKKKKKKKEKIKEEAEEQGIQSDQLDSNRTMNETNDAEPVEKKKKKKKKDKRVKEEDEEIAVFNQEIHGSDSSGYLSDKQSKKRKRENSELSENPTLAKSKKKKREQIDQFA